MERTPWSWWRVAATVVAPVFGVTAVAIVVMQLTGTPDAVTAGVWFGVLAGGAVALMLVARHFWRLEQTASLRELDIAERRGSETYARAADQLGADKAPVRLAGLYALERLAQVDAQYRQTVINVICSYLRMPYTPPEQGGETMGDVAERGVRVAAQRVLASHLRPADAELFWADIDLDLAGATLIDFSLTGARLRTAAFERAHFAGDISFAGTQVAGDARFGSARFVSRRADFQSTWFAGRADFTGSGFAGETVFAGAKFSGETVFAKTVFAGAVDFSQVAFHGPVAFRNVMFVGRSDFATAWFGAEADFSSAAFSKDALFNGIRFEAHVEALGAYFAAHASFRNAWFNRNADLRAARFGGNVDFTEAWFGTSAMLDGGRVRVDADRSLSIWPSGWAIREPQDDLEARLADREGDWGYLVRTKTPEKPSPVKRGAPPNAP